MPSPTLDAVTCERLRRATSADDEFRRLTHWLDFRIGVSIGDQHACLRLRRGVIETVEPGIPDDLRFRLIGDEAAWAKLLDPDRNGGIHRLFREKEVRIEGDLVEAIRDWKAVWLIAEHLTAIWQGAK